MSGLRVRVVAPAGPPRPGRLEAGLAELGRLGCRVSTGRALRRGWGHLAGGDEERAADLMEALLDPDTDLVWAARGGFGGLRLLPLLDWGRLEARRGPRPPLVGYSDLTSLQNLLRARLDWPCWHAPMVATELAEARDPLSAASLAGMLGALSGTVGELCAVLDEAGWRLADARETAACAARLVLEGEGFRQTLGLPAAAAWAGGRAAGPLAGGNLSVLTSLFGAWAGPPRGSLLLLEDHGEYPFRLDRHLAQLRNSGALASVAAVLLGPFLDCAEPDPDKATFSAEELLRQYLLPLGVPVLADLPFGHQAPRLSIPLHGQATVEA